MGNLRKELNGEPLWGLPDQISEELLNTHRLIPIRWLGHWLFMIIMCAGFGVGGIWLWPYLERLNVDKAVIKAAELNGLMYDVNFGFGLLIALFVWIFATAAFSLIILRVAPMPIKGALFFGVSSDLDTSGSKQQQTLDAIMERADKPESAAELINRFTEPYLKKALIILLPISLLIVPITYRETNVFSVYSEAGFFRSGYFSNATLSWDEVSSVELGCNQTDEGGSLVYEIHFPDRSIRIEDGISINNSHWLDNLEKIDAKIASGSAKFNRWKWLNRDSLHPKCLRGFYGELGTEGKQRIDKLLRIGEI